jgi:hypothetical protein
MPVGLAQEAALNLNLDTKLSGDCLLLCYFIQSVNVVEKMDCICGCTVLVISKVAGKTRLVLIGCLSALESQLFARHPY